jgi:hypothetical protein
VSNILEFKKKNHLNSTIHEFIHLKENYYLFIQPINEQNQKMVSIKCLENDQVSFTMV